MKPPYFAELYHIVFADAPRTLLEIGVHEGGSLRAWDSLFPGCVVVGLDRRQVNVPRCTVFTGDQVDELMLRTIARLHAPFCVVIDDGGHKQHEQRISFTALWPHVRPGGWYVIEDLHTGQLDGYNPTDEPTTLDSWIEMAEQGVSNPGQNPASAIMFSDRSVAIRKREDLRCAQ